MKIKEKLFNILQFNFYSKWLPYENKKKKEKKKRKEERNKEDAKSYPLFWFSYDIEWMNFMVFIVVGSFRESLNGFYN